MNIRRTFVNKGQNTSVWGPNSTEVIPSKITFSICRMWSGSTYPLMEANLVTMGWSWLIKATLFLSFSLDRSTKVIYLIFSSSDPLLNELFLSSGDRVFVFSDEDIVKFAALNVMANRINMYCGKIFEMLIFYYRNR